MRHVARLGLGLLLVSAAGCHDYSKLQQSFCATARKLVYSGTGSPSDQPVGLCDGFEGQGVDSALWQVESATGGTATVARAGAADDLLANSNRGRSALVLRAPSAGSRAQVIESRLTPMFSKGAGSGSHRVDDTYFAVRMYLNEGAGVLPSKTQVLALEDATGKQRVAFGYRDGKFALDDGDDGRELVTSGQPPAGEWICIELRFGASTGLEVWGDGEAPLYTLAGFPQEGGFSRTRIGVARAADDPYAGEESVWIDDVIIDDQTIGCAK